MVILSRAGISTSSQYSGVTIYVNYFILEFNVLSILDTLSIIKVWIAIVYWIVEILVLNTGSCELRFLFFLVAIILIFVSWLCEVGIDLRGDVFFVIIECCRLCLVNCLGELFDKWLSFVINYYLKNRTQTSTLYVCASWKFTCNLLLWFRSRCNTFNC